MSVFNIDKILFDCIDSIIKQKISCIEIIICITKFLKTVEIDKLYEYLLKYDNNVTILKEKSSSLNICRNRAIDISKGEYLIFINSYENLYDNSLYRYYSESELNSLDLLKYDYSFFNKDREWSSNSSYLGEKIINVSNERYINDSVCYSKDFYKNYLEKDIDIFNLSTFFIKKSYLVKNNIYFDENLNIEESVFILKLLNNDGKIKYCNIKCFFRYDISYFQNKYLISNYIFKNVNVIPKEFISIYYIDTKLKEFKCMIKYILINLTCGYLQNKTIVYILEYIMHLKKICDEEIIYYIDNFIYELKLLIKDDVYLSNCFIESEIILYTPSLYNRLKGKIKYDFINNEYTNIVKLTELLNSTDDNFELEDKFLSKLLSIINSSKLFDKFVEVNQIRELINRGLDINKSLIFNSINRLIDDLYFEIEPDLENYTYTDNKLKIILKDIIGG